MNYNHHNNNHPPLHSQQQQQQQSHNSTHSSNFTHHPQTASRACHGEDNLPLYGTMDNHHSGSNNTSTTTSRHTSTASIWSLHNHITGHSRNPTPPTPVSSPSLYTPPPPPENPRKFENGPHLHPTQSQYRQNVEQAPAVRETHVLGLDFDPISGRKIINHYTIIDEIGRGVHGKVKLGTDIDTGELVAIKIVERVQDRPRLGRRGDGESEKKVRREIAILKKCRHENVVRLLEVIDDPQSKKVYLILEYVQLGEIIWRKEGDPDVLSRERRRLRKEFAEARSSKELTQRDEIEAVNKALKKKKRRRTRGGQFWSLEFASPLGDSEESEQNSPPPMLPKLLPTSSADLPPLDSETEQLPPAVTGYSSDSDSDRDSAEDQRYIPALTIEQARSTFRDTVLGLEYLHYHGIIHRDIKPANLLWTKDHRVKISDFGVSFLGRPIRDDDDGESTGTDEAPTGLEQNDIELAKTAGTPVFFAPELCHIDPTGPRPQITSAIDVWALGVTLYCLLFARCPFMAANEFQLLKCIAKEELMIPNRRIRPEKLKRSTNSSSPPSAEELLEMETEPVDEDLKDLLKRLLIKDPSKRITLKEVKRHPWVLHGIVDPCAWVDDTDPERISDGNRIEVTVEDVEKAVSSAGVLHRARSAMKKAGAWYRGLRKRASSTADAPSTTSFKDARDKRPERKWEPEDASYYPPKDDDEKELQWMGGAPAWNEERRPSMTTFGSTASTDTVQPPVSHERSRESPNPNAKTSPGFEGRKLRRRPSVNLLATSRRHAHSESGSGHRSPSTSSTSRFSDIKGESAPAIASPQHGSGGLFRDGMKKFVGKMRSGGLSSENGDKTKDPISREGSPLRARDALAGHLRGDHSFYAYAHHSLQVQIPQYRRHSYTCEQIEATVPLDSPHRFSPGGSRMSRGEEARRKLSSLAVDDQPCPPSPDDNISMESFWRRDQQKRLLRVEERERYSQPSSSTVPGWTRENRYYSTTDSPTPPIAIDGKVRSGFFGDNIAPSVLPHHPNSDNQLVSSSSEERFATTAGSSLTNSTSFPSVPSVLSESSSLSSSDFYGRNSRKSSIAGLMEEESLAENGLYEYLRKERPGTPYHENFNNFSNPDIDEEVDEATHANGYGGDEGDSDDGLVLSLRATKPRSGSVTVAELSRKPIDSPTGTTPRTRRRSRSSSGTVKEKSSRSGQRGRTKEKTVTE